MVMTTYFLPEKHCCQGESLTFDRGTSPVLCPGCPVRRLLILYQLQGPGIAPPNARRARWDTTKIALQREACFSLDEKGFFWTGGSANQTHIVGLITKDQIILGSTGCVDKRAGNGGKKSVPFSENPDTGPSRIGYTGYVVQTAGQFAVPAPGTFCMINLDSGHI